jgi:hypothetical protein
MKSEMRMPSSQDRIADRPAVPGRRALADRRSPVVAVDAVAERIAEAGHPNSLERLSLVLKLPDSGPTLLTISQDRTFLSRQIRRFCREMRGSFADSISPEADSAAAIM